MQQTYARIAGSTETVAVRELVEDALKMHSEAYLRHTVTVVREYDETPPITVDKHRVLQVLVNLLRTAKHMTLIISVLRHIKSLASDPHRKKCNQTLLQWSSEM